MFGDVGTDVDETTMVVDGVVDGFVDGVVDAPNPLAEALPPVATTPLGEIADALPSTSSLDVSSTTVATRSVVESERPIDPDTVSSLRPSATEWVSAVSEDPGCVSPHAERGRRPASRTSGV